MARRSQTKTNNSTSQGKHKTAETSEPTTIPPAKTRTYHCATGRQTDRQTDRSKTKRQLRQNITQEAIMTYLEMLKPGYQKNWGTLKAAITLH